MDKYPPGSALRTHRLRELAVEAEVDPRTIRKLLLGEPMRESLSKQRATAVLQKHGLLKDAEEKG